MSSSLLIKRRIKSVTATSKLTKAMQMIAAVNMKRAVKNAIASRPFTHATWKVLYQISDNLDFSKYKHPYLELREGNKALIVIMASNRGLCGAFHANLEKNIRQTIELNKEHGLDFDYSAIVIGKKGENIAKKLGIPMVASFTHLENRIADTDVNAIFKVVSEEYLEGNFDRVILFYTDHINTMIQIPHARQLLPIVPEDLIETIKEIPGKKMDFENRHQKIEYKAEPDFTAVLDSALPLLIRAIIYHALLESKASAESARMIAMKNASESAIEMKDSLTLAFNQIRQGKITAEIAEIAASKAALE
ncbi:MAG: ATP synthase F1 subunit gamma [Pseudomonadales bacterium]|jgi:F-type H+-transporting ATPase subunit gamma|nr:ATP synthase F1 subunit gamma [Pseudomonadales bacterium]